ncbi:MAG: hypothetical protein QOI41_2910 [Myxococcales bacterium]|nr:hypothetical protein [Myxococcales bacterium]
MNSDDLTPLARQDGDPLARALLRAGQRERPPKRSEERLLTVLGVGGSVGGATALASVVRLATRLGTKGALTSLALAVAAIGVGLWVAHDTSGGAASTLTSPPPPSAPASVVLPPAPPARSPPTTTEAPPAEATGPSVPTTRVEDLPTSEPPGTAKTLPPRGASATGDDGPSLAREVELIGAARVALARGDATSALRALDAHDREAPHGTLLPESRVLRIEALVLAGGADSVALANTLGDSFLASNPTGPQARRVRAVLDRTHEGRPIP